jgi:hypothetical protein
VPLSTFPFTQRVYAHVIRISRIVSWGRWWNNVEINGIKLGWVGGDWIHVTQEREQRRALFNTGKKVKVA